MTYKQAIQMIDEYISEPNFIKSEWVECLQLCKKALKKTIEAEGKED